MNVATHTVTAQDGVTISCDAYQGEGRDTALVICPGFFQSKETATFQRMSRALAVHWDVLAMDFRGHGRSGGLYTFSALERADLEAVLRWVQGRYRGVGILSFSLGAAIAINTVSRHHGVVQSLIAVSAPSAFEDIEFKFWTPEAMRTGLTGLEPGAGCRPSNPLMKKDRPLDTVRHLGNTPLLFIHGTHDVIVDVQHSHRLHAAAAEPKRLEIIEGGSHAEALFRDDPTRFLSLVETWVAKTLGGARTPADPGRTG